MATLVARFNLVFSSDSAYVGSILLAFGLFGAIGSMWMQAIA